MQLKEFMGAVIERVFFISSTACEFISLESSYVSSKLNVTEFGETVSKCTGLGIVFWISVETYSLINCEKLRFTS